MAAERRFHASQLLDPAELALVYDALHGRIPFINGEIHLPGSRAAAYLPLMAKLEAALVPNVEESAGPLSAEDRAEFQAGVSG